jgi:hypothetical protein
MRLRPCVLAASLAALLLAPGIAGAQELEPRAYSPSPVGANFAAVIYGRSWGALVFDPSIPITDAEADLNNATLAYGRTFSLAGRQALVTAGVPWIRGDFSGKLVGNDSSVTRRGLGDARVKLSVNLIGAPAMSPQAFAQSPPRPVVAGLSLTVSAPTGQNSPDKLINLGANRWAFKPELGASWNVRRRWYADVYAGTWLFTANPEAFPAGTARRTQDPLGSVQGHLSYTFARRSWAAFDYTWFWGGATHTNGGPPSARVNNQRVGGIVAIGLTPRQSLKFGYSYGASTRLGDDFGTASAAWQVLWF